MLKISHTKRITIGLVVVTAAALMWFFVADEFTRPTASTSRPGITRAQPSQAARQASTPSTDHPKSDSAGNNLSSIRLEIRDTKNLRATLDKLRALPDPSGDINYMLARAVSDCYSYGGFALENLKEEAESQPNLVHRYQRLKLIEGRAARCTSFESLEASANLMAELDEQSAKSRHPGALTTNWYPRMRREGPDTADAHMLSLLERSPSADVLDNVHDYLRLRNNQTLKRGEGIDSNSGAAAWMLLQCDLGQDCSGESLLMVRACAVRGRCGGNDVYGMVRESWLTPEEYEKAIAMKEDLLAALQAKDWVRLGFVPLPDNVRQKLKKQ